MTGRDDLPLDVFALVERLLPGVALTSSQLAGVRAANTRHYTAVAALQRQARAEGREWAAPSAAERAALLSAMLDDLRGLLRDGQRLAGEPDP